MSLKIIFMGTSEFARECLKALLSSKHELIGVFTQPDRPKGRGLKYEPSPVKKLAIENGLSVFEPVKIKDKDVIDKIKILTPELILVCAYGKILPKEILEIPKYGAINVHASLLPSYRGASPINWAIINGEKETGITIMQMDEGMDTGPILLQGKIPIEDNDTAGSLEEKLSKLGAELLLVALDKLLEGKLTLVLQDNSKASYAPLIKKEDARIDWNLSALDIWRRIRGFNPKPGAFIGEGNNLIKIWKAEPVSGKGKPGEVILAEPGGIVVACGSDALRIVELQPSGKRKMLANEFLSGHRLKKGDFLPS